MKQNKPKKIIIIGVIVLIVLIAVVIPIQTYNKLVSLQEEVKTQYSDIDIQLQRRANIVPNLVNTVKGYMAHEKSVIEKVTEARTKLLSANNAKDAATANQQLTTSVNQLLALTENYPDLKANEQFTGLRDELAGSENRISVARIDYNETVKEYNKEIKKFPNNLLASMFGFEESAYFEADESAHEVPNVSFE